LLIEALLIPLVITADAVRATFLSTTPRHPSTDPTLVLAHPAVGDGHRVLLRIELVNGDAGMVADGGE
jgi:hypothetical protein